MSAIPLRLADEPAEDAALIERGIAGDQQALTALYKRHAAHIAGVVYRILGQDADLDDIMQETFVEGLRQLHALHEPSKLRSFLVTIAVRRIHARLSLRYRLRALASQLFGVSPQVSNPADADDVAALYKALGRVDPRHRIVWVLHRIEGYTLPEVAEQSGASLATVKRWITDVDKRVEDDDARR